MWYSWDRATGVAVRAVLLDQAEQESQRDQDTEDHHGQKDGQPEPFKHPGRPPRGLTLFLGERARSLGEHLVEDVEHERGVEQERQDHEDYPPAA